MEKILKLLATDLSFLYRENGFKFIDSDYADCFGGSAFITLAQSNIKVRIVQSRDGLNIEFGGNRGKQQWFSFDIIQRFLFADEKNKNDGIVCKESLSLLKQNMGLLIDAFSSEKKTKTL